MSMARRRITGRGGAGRAGWAGGAGRVGRVARPHLSRWCPRERRTLNRNPRKKVRQATLIVASRLNHDVDMLKLRHHSLVAWQRADDLFIHLHKLTIKSFPSFERYELGSQLRKAAYSVPANIAEGYGRRHQRDRLHFLNISEASLAEVAYCVHAAGRLGYLDDPSLKALEKELNGVGAPLAGLIRSVETSQSE